MTIVVPCPKCQHKLTINVKKVEKLEARIKELESTLSLYRSTSKSDSYPVGGFGDLSELFKGFSKH